jgi:hypothetical protein
MVEEIRQRHPRAGTRKLLIYMRLELQQSNIKIGRDSLNKLLREKNLLVKKPRRDTLIRRLLPNLIPRR